MWIMEGYENGARKIFEESSQTSKKSDKKQRMLWDKKLAFASLELLDCCQL